MIEARRQEGASGPPEGDRRDATVDATGQLLHPARTAAERMAHRVALFGEDADLRDAFRVANRAVARALRRHLRTKDRAGRAALASAPARSPAAEASPASPTRTTHAARR